MTTLTPACTGHDTAHPAKITWDKRELCVDRRLGGSNLIAMRSWLRFTLPGLIGALIFLALSFTPSLLPRPHLFQGLVTGVTAAIGYGIGVSVAWVWRGYANRTARHPTPRTWKIFGAIAIFVIAISAFLSDRWQTNIREFMGADEPSAWRFIVIPLVAAIVFLLVITVSRLLRVAYRLMSDLLARKIGPKAAAATGWVAVTTVSFFALSGLVWNPLIETLDSTFALQNNDDIETLPIPETEFKSGSDESLVSWESLGREGRRFVASGHSAEDISEFTGREALEPVRAYAGTDTASDIEERAAIAVADLERAGGFEREYLMVAGTTGSGYVEPSASDSFEYFADGDSAIVAIQYSHLPSWLSFLVDQNNARDAGRALFDAVYDVWVQLPADERPQLYLFGESLGSFSLETAFSGESDLSNRTSGGLLVGPPNFNDLWQEFRERRDDGSREAEPVFRDGRVVRFSDSSSKPAPPANEPWEDTRVLYLVNATDPITWWSVDLIWNRPDWLTESAGSGLSGSMRWFPVVTFWQTSADMAVSMSGPPGTGHNFVGEHVSGWRQIMELELWSDDDVAELQEMIIEADPGIPPSMRD